MTSLSVLALPDFSLPFDITTDASGMAVGAVLSQNNHPIAFFSKKMCPRMCAASAYVRELYAITEAVRKWRQYLLDRPFHIYTDHQSIKGLLTQTVQTPEQTKWLSKLMGFSYEIHYKPGTDNMVADALSHVSTESTGSYLAVSSPIPLWLDRLRIFYASHPSGQRLLQLVSPSARPHCPFKERAGLLYHKDRLYIPPDSGLSQRLIAEFHSTSLGGHSGIKPTLARLAAAFSWPGMHKEVKQFIQLCAPCQQNKYLPHSPYGLLQSLPMPQQVWEDISMDVITHIPTSAGKSVIWVVVDRLTKFAHFIALTPGFTASSLASLFIFKIYRLHGAPKLIISDRDRIFVSRF
ncbi:UNVERIFIED_CONTAM: Retrovirus-related Pol polyprotein from transposon.6 [Sesamum latifolium]|uniref:Retrovirus-related Pol polyprotein from transposon.6 n=1 Tax=Sesamum latifolium TaxID=2727402 RepID=A0AAW2TKU0_9LAMI